MKENTNENSIMFLFKFAKEKKGLYVLSVIFAFISVLVSIGPYLLMGDIIQQLVAKNNSYDFYIHRIILIAIFWIIKVICHGLSTTCSHIATFNVLGNIRKATLDKLSKVPLGYVKDTSSGSLKNIIVERIDSIETTLAHILPEFTSNIMAPVILGVLIFLVDWKMGLISLITLPLGILCYMAMMIGYEENWKNAINKTKNLNDVAIEYINGIEVIKAFGKAKTSYEKFVIAAKEGASCYVNWMKKTNVFFSIAYTLTPCTLLTVVPLGGLFVMNGWLSVSNFIYITILSIGLITPLLTCMSYSDDIAKLSQIVNEIKSILNEKELDRPLEDLSTINHYDIELKNVKFGYHNEEILHGVNMQIKENSINAIVGPSGSGKSTIAKLIASLWDIDHGSISIGGVNIKNLSLENYYNKVAYVSQDNFMFDESVMENIRHGNPSASDEEVVNVAKKSGCHDFIMSLENGYQTIVGGAGGHLSGGEKQRVSIARAMLKNAPIVILDEATAYTDPENEALIQSSIAKLVQGKTLIVIAHRLSTIIDADQIFVVNDGNIVSSGTHEELLQNCILYKDMWNAHISVKDNMEGEIVNA